MLSFKKRAAADVPTPAATKVTVFFDDTGAVKKKDETGAVADLASGAQSGSSALLAVTSYNPGTLATYSTTSSTSVDVDAVNLAVTFTVPASGRVLVRLTALGSKTGTGSAFWQVREGAAVVSGDMQVTNGTITSVFAVPFLIVGLTPSASLTYKWGYHRDSSATATVYAGGIAGPAVMEVWAAP